MHRSVCRILVRIQQMHVFSYTWSVYIDCTIKQICCDTKFKLSVCLRVWDIHNVTDIIYLWDSLIACRCNVRGYSKLLGYELYTFIYTLFTM